MVSIVSAVRPPQRWPAAAAGDSGVGGALVQSHPCFAPVGGGGGDKDVVSLACEPLSNQGLEGSIEGAAEKMAGILGELHTSDTFGVGRVKPS